MLFLFLYFLMEIMLMKPSSEKMMLYDDLRIFSSHFHRLLYESWMEEGHTCDELCRDDIFIELIIFRPKVFLWFQNGFQCFLVRICMSVWKFNFWSFASLSEKFFNQQILWTDPWYDLRHIEIKSCVIFLLFQIKMSLLVIFLPKLYIFNAAQDDKMSIRKKTV